MGLGQGAYVGKKITTTSVARLSGISSGRGKAGVSIILSGVGFGDQPVGNLITIDGSPISPPADGWSATSISFKLPDEHPNGTTWSKGQRISIGLIVGGREGANALPFTIDG